MHIAHPKRSIVDQKYREHLITSEKKRKFVKVTFPSIACSARA